MDPWKELGCKTLKGRPIWQDLTGEFPQGGVLPLDRLYLSGAGGIPAGRNPPAALVGLLANFKGRNPVLKTNLAGKKEADELPGYDAPLFLLFVL